MNQQQIQNELIVYSLICKGYEFDFRKKRRPRKVLELTDREKSLIGMYLSVVLVHFKSAKRETVLSDSQEQEDVVPRQVVMYLAHKHSGITEHKLGAYFSRDHSTVNTSKKRIKGYIKNEKPFRELVSRIENELTQTI